MMLVLAWRARGVLLLFNGGGSDIDDVAIVVDVDRLGDGDARPLAKAMTIALGKEGFV